MLNTKPSPLKQEHKQHEFFDNYPQTMRHGAVKSLTDAFEGFNLKETSIGNFILPEYNLAVKKATLNPISRNSLEILRNATVGQRNGLKAWI